MGKIPLSGPWKTLSAYCRNSILQPKLLARKQTFGGDGSCPSLNNKLSQGQRKTSRVLSTSKILVCGGHARALGVQFKHKRLPPHQTGLVCFPGFGWPQMVQTREIARGVPKQNRKFVAQRTRVKMRFAGRNQSGPNVKGTSIATWTITNPAHSSRRYDSWSSV